MEEGDVDRTKGPSGWRRVKQVVTGNKGNTTVFASVEAGGTSFRVALARGDPTNITERLIIPTTTPEETLGQVCEWLRERSFDALGVASFGPVDLNPASETYGYITSTPKKQWVNTDILTPILKACPRDVVYGFETDVNAPAMAEYTLGGLRAAGLSSCAYITVGTGIGVGLVINGQCVHGLLHPEAGHVPIPPPPGGDSLPPLDDRRVYGGAESRCCAGAIAQRAGVDPTELAELADDHDTFQKTAYYLAGLCVNLILIASPERIILSGGVMKRLSLFPAIRTQVQELLNGYIDHPNITTDRIGEYIIPSQWADDAGLIGSLALAQIALFRKQQETVLQVPTAGPADARPEADAFGYLQLQSAEDKHFHALMDMQAAVKDEVIAELRAQAENTKGYTKALAAATVAMGVAGSLLIWKRHWR